MSAAKKLLPPRKPTAVAIGFFYSSKRRADVLRLEVDLYGVSSKDRRRVVDRFTKLAEHYGMFGSAKP